MTSAVPKIQFTAAGLVLPTEAAILAGAQSDIDAAFGGGTNPALETPQGQIASSQTAAISDKNYQIATIVNQIDPQYSDGRFQDAICRFYYLTRKPGLPTSVTATLNGSPLAVIPAGILVRDTSANTYVLADTVTIDASGTCQAVFNNLVTGPIPCAAGTLTEIYQAVSGLDAITNVAAGAIGRDVEGRYDLEYRRRNSVALNSHGTLNSIYAAVFAVNGVLDVFAYENHTSSVLTYGSTNYPLAKHSIYVAVSGGSDTDVAAAIWTKKDGGCDYNGNTQVIVSDDSGYSYPLPSYVVKFERPDGLPIKFAVQLVNDYTLPSNIIQLVQDAIIARFNGADGTARERIGSFILASRYYGAVANCAPNVSLIGILIGTSTATLTRVTVGIDQRPTVSSSDITVTLV